MPGPSIGQIVDGYRFKGGDPNSQSSWEAVPSGGAAPAGTTRLPNGTLLSAPGPRGGAPRALMGLSVQEQKQLADARRAGAAMRTDLADTERFARLQEERGTGGLMALPFAPQIAAAFDPEVDEMNEISARLTPAQRPAGSGATSDFEQRLYGRSVPSPSRTEQGNTAVINRGRSRAGEAQLRSEFLDSYASRNGTLQGAEQAWNNAYDPPPVARSSPEPRANVRPTEAQRRAVESLQGRDRNAQLGTRANPRVPPQGFDPAQLPAGDWYINADGQLLRGGPLQAQSRQTRTGVRSVRRVD